MPDPTRILLHNSETRTLAAKLMQSFPDVEISTCNSYEALPDAVAGTKPHVVYSVRFDGTPGFPREALFSTPGPTWIANGGAGTDHFGSWDPERVTVTNAAGVAAEMMAEYVFGAFLHFTLDVPGLQSDKAQRVWHERRVRPLKGQTLLIVGLGHTGRAIAAHAKAFGMKVIGTRAHPCDMEFVDEVHGADQLRCLLPRADFVAVSTPMTAATVGLISAAEIAAMKHGVVLADVSRGGVIDQTALLKALENGKIAAAALDVFEVEPLPKDSPLWAVDNLLISPHCSSVYEGWERASFDLFLANLARWLDGKELSNIVDPHMGY